MPAHPQNDKTWSFALTFRPKDGLQKHHETRLRAYLNKWADQWDRFVVRIG